MSSIRYRVTRKLYKINSLAVIESVIDRDKNAHVPPNDI